VHASAWSLAVPDDPDARPPAIDWQAAIREHNRRVVVSLLAMGLQLADAEDLAQRAWMKLMKQHEDGKLHQVKLPGLAITQARFFALSALRQDGKRESKTDRIDAGTVVLAFPEQPESRLLSKEQLDKALAVLADSHDNAQRVFRMLYDDPPPTHAQVAEKIGLSVQRVRQILWEVRKKMREAITAEDDR
jgi:RNA polymerase sigma-70 factor (ECF subfamily)